METINGYRRFYESALRLKKRESSTISTYSGELSKYEEWCGAEEVQTLTVHSARLYLGQVLDRSESQAFMACRAIKSFGKWYAEEYDTANPFAGLRSVKQPDAKPQRTAKPSDVTALLGTCSGTDLRSLRDTAIIVLLATTGMRRSEVCRMRWTDFDPLTGALTIPKTKTHKSRKVRISLDVLRAMKRYERALDLCQRRDPDGFVWVSTTRPVPLTPNGLTQMVLERSRAAGVDVSAHSFRRGLAVEWLHQDGSETYLKRFCGWTDGRMVSRYVDAVAEDEALAEHERIFG
ncbi:MAG: site-specific integrase [Ilumatobacter fluminis]|uniref:tyrosine-type recombinase/integrase n=1 Tax=Ilumatobacter fluminis TaxID=467091 RepID=UPI0032EFF69C